MVKEKQITAFLLENGSKIEVRCSFCGKKLLEMKENFQKKEKKVLTSSKKCGTIILVKCGRCGYMNTFHT